jgi:hypothetical protein
MLKPAATNFNQYSETGIRVRLECHYGNFLGYRWRKHMGVEPTSRIARIRDDGFEDRRQHRLPRASAFAFNKHHFKP